MGKLASPMRFSRGVHEKGYAEQGPFSALVFRPVNGYPEESRFPVQSLLRTSSK